MLQCPQCDYTNRNYKSVHKHLKRKHPEITFVPRSIRRIGESSNAQMTQVLNSPPLESYGFLFLVPYERVDALAIRNLIITKFRSFGLNLNDQFDAPVVISNPTTENVKDSILYTMDAALKASKKKCKMIFCIVDGSEDLYKSIKRIALCEVVVLTQCMQGSNLKSVKTIKDQFLANFCLKANLKLGGFNNTVISSIPGTQPVSMYIGIDVSHPPENSKGPSVCAIVTSLDVAGVRSRTSTRVQEQRSEIVEHLYHICYEALLNFKKETGSYPARIMVYRDGVGSGQFDQVYFTEVNAIQKACEQLKATDLPKITFVIVQKRHHIRAFPLDGDRTGNCVPGTVIDSDIVHPTDFDFYLQSHAGIQGTTRPTHYSVLFDENELTADQVQSLTFDLCFLGERATRAISIPAPCYFAHLASKCTFA